MPQVSRNESPNGVGRNRVAPETGAPARDAAHRTLAWLLPLAVFVAVIGKIAAIAVYGPLQMGPDTRFVETAEKLLAGGRWLTDAGLLDEAIPHSLWKTNGYSVLIAGLAGLFGAAWPWALYAVQSLFSLAAGLCLYRLARLLGLGPVPAVLVFALYQSATPLSTDMLIAADSLGGSLATLLVADFGIVLVTRRLVRPGRAALYGVVLSICFLLRFTLFYWAILFVPLFVLLNALASRSARATLASAAGLIVPLCLLFTMHLAWNHQRTGHWIGTTAGQTGYVVTAIRFAEIIEPAAPQTLFIGPDALDTAIRDVLTATPGQGSYVQTNAINLRLFEQQGWTAIDIDRAATARYWGMARAYPLMFVRFWLINGSWPNQSALFTGPVRQLDELRWWRSVYGDLPDYYAGWRHDLQRFMATRDLADLTPAAVVNGGLRLGLRLAGTLLLGVLALGSLIGALHLWRDRDRTDIRLAYATACGGLYFLTVAMYALCFVELRYLSPVIGPALLALVYLARAGIDWMRRRRRPCAPA